MLLCNSINHKVSKLNTLPTIVKQTTRMAQASNAVVLSGTLGSEKIFGSKRDIPGDNKMTMAKVDGSSSFYVVYREPQYQETGWDSKCSKIVDSSTEIELGFNARSTQGWDKAGISVFEHIHYCGTGETYRSSYPDITGTFPSGDRGASSIIVTKGMWALYSGKNYKGIQIAVNRQNEFGPGARIPFIEPANDMVKSVKLLREN